IDNISPAVITDLRPDVVGCTDATLSWTAPGDDASQGAAQAYDLRWSPNPIQSEFDFYNSQPLFVGQPQAAGSFESYTFDFGQCAHLYVAIRSSDLAGNLSGIGSYPYFTGTPCPPPECFPERSLAIDFVTGLGRAFPSPAIREMRIRLAVSRHDASTPVDLTV